MKKKTWSYLFFVRVEINVFYFKFNTLTKSPAMYVIRAYVQYGIEKMTF